MKTAIGLVMLVCLSTGCFAAQRDAINQNFAARIKQLDTECKENMTDWCVMQYRIAEEERSRALDDVDTRQRATADSIRKAGEPFANLGHK